MLLLLVETEGMRTLPLILLLTIGTAQAQNCSTVRYLEEVFENVHTVSAIKFGEADPYGVLGSQDLLLDLYRPAGDVLEKHPVIIYAFGGGFLIGTRFQPPIPEFCERWARMGYVVAAIDYRIGFNTTSQGSVERAVYRGVQDVRAAMRFLGEFSETYGIDTTSIFLTGSSAGCFSALHSTFMEEADRPASTFGILLEPGDMGCSDCSGNTHLGNRELRPRGIINHWGAMLDTTFIDPTEKDNVPVISFHGTDDLIVPFESGSPFSYPVFPVVRGSAPIHQRLSNLGVMNELHAWEGIGHEPWLTEPRLIDTVFVHAPPFLYETMRPQTSAILGDAQVPLGEVRTYTVTGWPDSQFCWEVTGGTIIADNGTSVDVLWDAVGTWSVSVTELSCIEVVGHSQLMDVEVQQPTSAGQLGSGEILCYPNPSGGHVTIVGLPDEEVTATIAGMDGRVVAAHHARAVSGQLRLDLSTLSSGAYAVRLTSRGSDVRIPLIVHMSSD